MFFMTQKFVELFELTKRSSVDGLNGFLFYVDLDIVEPICKLWVFEQIGSNFANVISLTESITEWHLLI